MKISTLIAVTSLSVVTFSAWSQVGIGVASPNTNSILDLTNGNNKGLLLPILSTPPAAGTYPEGILFYYDSMVYVRNATGFNGITPWKYKYNGSTSEAVYFNPASYVGVGIGVNDAALRGNLHVSLNGKDAGISGTSAAIFVGNTDAGTHMLIDNDEIMVKTNSTTGGVLKLQEGSGSVQVGQNIATPSNLNVFGKVKENGNDLLPQGVVVMWSGALAAIPNGWALCDGQRYQINTTTGITEVVATGGFQTPDLRERFIVGASSTDNPSVPGTPFAAGATGGGTTHTLTAANIPNHRHEANGNGATMNITSSGAHQHINQESAIADNDDFDGVGNYIGGRGYSFNNDEGGSGFITADGSNHTHPNTSFAGLTGNGSGLGGATTTVTHGLPPYYALAYIVKL
jgi:microcystin-dependent protein